jgi:hypothetical protein
VLNVPTNARLYEFSQIELAQKYIHDLPQAIAVRICPIDGLSTQDESQDVGKCLLREGAKSVLIVTSDFHTRRALEVFRREIPGLQFSVAAARNDEQFGVRWWKQAVGKNICRRMGASRMVERGRSVALMFRRGRCAVFLKKPVGFSDRRPPAAGPLPAGPTSLEAETRFRNL